MWIKFTADFLYKPKRSVTLLYRAGDTANVVRACGEAAIAVGAGTELRKASKDADPVEVVET